MIPILRADLYWLAGLLEGEGSFGFYITNSRKGRGSLKLGLAMADRDVVERAGKLMGLKVHTKKGRTPSHFKPIWYTQATGAWIIQWFYILYPLMGVRRKEQIARAIVSYLNRRPKKPMPLRKLTPESLIEIRSRVGSQDRITPEAALSYGISADHLRRLVRQIPIAG